MKKLFFILSFSLFLSPFSFLLAEDTGVGIEVSASKKIVKGLEASVEAEVRTQDAVSLMERWSIGAGIDYKILKWLKADAGYILIDRYKPSHSYLSDKGNLKEVESIWSPRHRAYVSVNASWKPNKHWDFSLRERYQFTYETEQHAKCMNLTKNKRDDDKVYGGEAEHLLRSRIQAKYIIKKKCPWVPFANIEALNDLEKGFELDQMRYTLGTDYKINKKNSLGLAYRFKDKTTKDEDKGHLITFSYSYDF